MGSNTVLVVILCEDRLHEVFIRRCLSRLGYQSHELRVLPYRTGRGSGAMFVLDHYAEEVSNYRRRSNRARSGLIVIIDEDSLSVQGRMDALARRLDEEGLEPRQDSDQVAILIPKRNIATWINALSGQSVDEVTDYDQHHPWRGREGTCHPAPDALAEQLRSTKEPAADWPPSLQRAYGELQRLKWP